MRLLIVEDDASDAALTVQQLKAEGIDCTWTRVATEAAFRDALASTPDVIISDCRLPRFDGFAAFSIAASEAPEIPFVFVSGTLGDEWAREALKAGAAGYIAKGDRKHLAQTVRSALQRYPKIATRSYSMDAGGQTTVIQQVLERRSHAPLSMEQGDTTATIAVLLRVLPPLRALLAIGDSGLRGRIERQVAADLLDLKTVADDEEALRLFVEEFRPVIFTDSLELIRKLRGQPCPRVPYIVYVANIDEEREREAGLVAGADDCIGRRAGDRELHARVGAARRIAELEAVLRITLTENRKLSTTDDLTRVASRRFFSKQFPREVERAARYGRALSLILCDIDHFGQLNERLGHPGGDEILQHFGTRLQDALRRGIDWIARIGGEEFAIVLPEIGHQQALEVARKLCNHVASTAFSAQDQKIAVTASFGVCGLERVPVGKKGLSQHILKVADAALYRSKHAGRNSVTGANL
jgi:diguanylate cyclase (GGDEF)-like protein